MVTSNALYPAVEIFPDKVVKLTFYYYVWLGVYPMWFVAIDTYPVAVKDMYFSLQLLGIYLLPGNALVVTIQHLDFVMIH